MFDRHGPSLPLLVGLAGKRVFDLADAERDRQLFNVCGNRFASLAGVGSG